MIGQVARGAAANRWGTGCTRTDCDRHGRLDLFVSNYPVLDPDKVPARGKDARFSDRGIVVNRRPPGRSKEQYLHHDNGDCTFTDVRRQAGICTIKRGFGLTAAAADFGGGALTSVATAARYGPRRAEERTYAL